MKKLPKINFKTLFIFSLFSIIVASVNKWLLLGIILGVLARCYSGISISIAAGFTFGIILVELIKYFVFTLGD